MLTITGEVRKIIDSSYTDKKTGEPITQMIVIIEPITGRQNYEVVLKRSQMKPGMLDLWQSLKGQSVRVPVSLFVSYEHRFHKFNALGPAEPV